MAIKAAMRAVFAAAAIFGLSSGYYLDDSCRGPMRDYVERAMASNHKIAISAVEAMEMFRRHPDREKYTDDFAKEDAFVNFLGSLSRGDLPNPRAAGWRETEALFTWIARKSSRVLPTPAPKYGRRYGSLDSREVIIFCDYSRLHDNKDLRQQDAPGYATDEHCGLQHPMGQYYHMAKSARITITQGPPIQVDVGDFSYGWATCSQRSAAVSGSPSGIVPFPNTVQLNPNMIDIYQVLNRVGYVLETVAPDLHLKDRPIEQFKRNLDFDLFHELSHTFFQNMEHYVGDQGGYGWETCIRTSRQVGHRNADNIAFYAFTTYLTNTIPDPRNPDENLFEPVQFDRQGVPSRLWEDDTEDSESDGSIDGGT